MAGEEQYYSPIIQAMIANANDMRERQQNAVQAQKDQADLKIRQQLADQAMKEIDYTHEHNQKQIDIEAERNALEKKANQLKEKLDIGQAIRSGLFKPEAFQQPFQPGAQQTNGQPVPGIMGQSSGTPPGMITLPSGEHIPIPAIANPQEAVQQEAERTKQTAKAQSSGQAEGLEPYKVLEDLRRTGGEKAKLVQEHANRLEENRFKGQDEMAIARIHGGYQMANTNLEGANRLNEIAYTNQLALGGEDPTQAQNLGSQLIDQIDNGQRSYASLSKQEKMLVDSLASHRGYVVPTDQKAHSANLDQIQSVDTMLDQYRDLINKYSRDSPSQGLDRGTKITKGIAKATGGILAPTIPGSDLHAALEGVSSTAGKLAATFEQQKRNSDANIIRQVVGTFDPHNTREQNMKNLNQKADLLNQTVQRTFAGMPPEQINKILGDNGIKNLGGLQRSTPGTVVPVTRDAHGKFVIASPVGSNE